MTPSWRKPAGALAILLLILVWSLVIASLSTIVNRWPRPLQALFYLTAGLVWIVPMRPLLQWMETGRWR